MGQPGSGKKSGAKLRMYRWPHWIQPRATGISDCLRPGYRTPVQASDGLPCERARGQACFSSKLCHVWLKLHRCKAIAPSVQVCPCLSWHNMQLAEGGPRYETPPIAAKLCIPSQVTHLFLCRAFTGVEHDAIDASCQVCQPSHLPQHHRASGRTSTLRRS